MSKKLELASIGLKCLDIKLELRNASRKGSVLVGLKTDKLDTNCRQIS